MNVLQFWCVFPINTKPRIMNVLQFWCVFPYLLVSNSRIVNRVKFSAEISIYAQYYIQTFIYSRLFQLLTSMVTSIHLVKPLDFLSNNVFSKVLSMYKNWVNIARSIFFLQKIKEQEFQQFCTLFLACDATGVFHSREF